MGNTILIIIGLVILVLIITFLYLKFSTSKEEKFMKAIEEIDLILNSLNKKTEEELLQINLTNFLSTNKKYKKCLAVINLYDGGETTRIKKYPSDAYKMIEDRKKEIREKKKFDKFREEGIKYIQNLKLPLFIKKDFFEIHPNIDKDLWKEIEKQFENYILLFIEFNGETLTPSRTIEELWKIYELNLEAYERFCIHAFGRFVHVQKRSNIREENIKQVEKTFYNLGKSSLLDESAYDMFGLDEKTNIEGKYNYSYFLELK